MQFVLFIGAIVAILLLSFVLVSYSHILFKKKTDVTIAMIQASQIGLELSFKEPLETKEQFQEAIVSETSIDVTVQKKYWGLLEQRKVIAKKGQMQFAKIGFVGRTHETRPALYLKDNQRPMIIAGAARIKGNARLPVQGIKRGNIRGKGYSGSQLVYGQEEKSGTSLPRLTKEIQEQLHQFTQASFQPQGEQVPFQNALELQNSFNKEPKVIKGDFVYLANTKLTGNVMIWASQKIVVDPTAQLKDVVLLAPKIEIKNGVQGNFQAIAQEEIRVGKGCIMDYPTVLAIQQSKTFGRDEHKKREPNISLSSGTLVRGIVIYQQKKNIDRSKANIHVAENAVVLGEVYCEGNLELKGNIYGSATTHALVALENGSAYQNHLFNGTIDRFALPLEYSGLIYRGEQPNHVIKWLY